MESINRYSQGALHNTIMMYLSSPHRVYSPCIHARMIVCRGKILGQGNHLVHTY